MDFKSNIQKGYHRPVSLPRWKWIIVYAIWIVAMMGYILSLYLSLWLITVGVLFQFMGMYLPRKWDTKSWENTEEGKEYFQKYQR